jgi:hypothetical protein
MVSLSGLLWVDKLSLIAYQKFFATKEIKLIPATAPDIINVNRRSAKQK